MPSEADMREAKALADAREALSLAKEGSQSSCDEVARLGSLILEWSDRYKPSLESARKIEKHVDQIAALEGIQNHAAGLLEVLAAPTSHITITNLYGAYADGEDQETPRRRQRTGPRMELTELAKKMGEAESFLSELERYARRAIAMAEKTKSAKGGVSLKKNAMRQVKEAFAIEAGRAFIEFTGQRPMRRTRDKIPYGPWFDFFSTLMAVVLNDTDGDDNYARHAAKHFRKPGMV
jgi:hypothetical protein